VLPWRRIHRIVTNAPRTTLAGIRKNGLHLAIHKV
jgi:hypothetical protein